MTGYPLQWPPGFPRTRFRETGTFKTQLPAALKNLGDQVRLLGGSGLVLSSNCSLGMTTPADPGVVAYFKWDGTEMAIPCDRWCTVAANVQAIALTLEAMRGMERWGAKEMIRSMFRGVKALPSSGRHWREVLEFANRDRLPTGAQIEESYRALAKVRHPDTGGTEEAMAELNAARETALRECGN